ncbi:hypothetical protein MCGE09_00464 [Thaumarchaeota archaeon SCGC AB-539-E09]|nr:hypothetical protein MCGE09_00464 [Thaumarchaeota archaeon SCGC AB-539-E09]
MGRKSLAQEFFEWIPAEEEDGFDRTWIVLYDFKGIKPNPKFWVNLRRLKGLSGSGSLVQYSVFMTRSRRGAAVAVMLARHYGGEVMVFRGEEVELLSQYYS